MKMECKRNLTSEEIVKKFGCNQNELDLCYDTNCKNLKYSEGMLTCGLLLNQTINNFSKGE